MLSVNIIRTSLFCRALHLNMRMVNIVKRILGETSGKSSDDAVCLTCDEPSEEKKSNVISPENHFAVDII